MLFVLLKLRFYLLNIIIISRFCDFVNFLIYWLFIVFLLHILLSRFHNFFSKVFWSLVFVVYFLNTIYKDILYKLFSKVFKILFNSISIMVVSISTITLTISLLESYAPQVLRRSLLFLWTKSTVLCFLGFLGIWCCESVSDFLTCYYYSIYKKKSQEKNKKIINYYGFKGFLFLFDFCLKLLYNINIKRLLRFWFFVSEGHGLDLLAL